MGSNQFCNQPLKKMGCFELTYEGCVPSKSATWSHMVITCMYMTNHLRFLRCTSNYQRPMGFVKVVGGPFPLVVELIQLSILLIWFGNIQIITVSSYMDHISHNK